MKNSSRLEVKMARNLTRSSNGVRSSKASARTRRLNSSQVRSRSNQRSARFCVDMFVFLFFLREHSLPVNPFTHKLLRNQLADSAANTYHQSTILPTS